MINVNKFISKLFLILSLAIFSESISCQPESMFSKSEMSDSFGTVPNGDLRGHLDMFLATIFNNKGSRGLVAIYSSYDIVKVRRRIIENHVRFRGFDSSKITFRSGGSVSEFRSDLWVIPSDSTSPEINPEAYVAMEFGRIYKATAVEKINEFLAEQSNYPNYNAFIVNYGTSRQISLREKWITESVVFRTYDRSRVTLVNGGKGPTRTVMWLVPPKAELPRFE